MLRFHENPGERLLLGGQQVQVLRLGSDYSEYVVWVMSQPPHGSSEGTVISVGWVAQMCGLWAGEGILKFPDVFYKPHWWKKLHFHLRSVKSAIEKRALWQMKDDSISRDSTVTGACKCKPLVQTRARFPEKTWDLLSRCRSGRGSGWPGPRTVLSACVGCPSMEERHEAGGHTGPHLSKRRTLHSLGESFYTTETGKCYYKTRAFSQTAGS